MGRFIKYFKRGESVAQWEIMRKSRKASEEWLWSYTNHMEILDSLPDI